MTAPFYIPTSTVYRFQFFHVLTYTYLAFFGHDPIYTFIIFSFFNCNITDSIYISYMSFWLVMLVGMKWYLVVFIYISPLSNDVEQLFLWSLAIFFFFFLKAVCSNLCPFYFIILTVPCGIRDLSSPAWDWTRASWKHGVLLTGLPGKSQSLPILKLLSCTSSLYFLMQVPY